MICEYMNDNNDDNMVDTERKLERRYLNPNHQR